MKNDTAQEKISVIMPCYNSEKYISKAIDSVLEQTYPNVELIIIDDGSTDGSLAIINEYISANRGNIVLVQQANLGPYPARNNGIRHATGQLIAFLDADDYWHEECLTKLHQSLSNNSHDLSYCGWQNVGQGGPGNAPFIPPKYEETDIHQQFIRGCPWPIHAALTRKKIIDLVGGFSERYFSSMDYDLWIRISALTQKISIVPEVLAFYRWHDSGQISSLKWRQTLDAWKVRHDFINENPSLIAHIPKVRLRQLVDKIILDRAYDAYWKRDLTSAQILFRKSFFIGYFGMKDLKYVLPSLLPKILYKLLVNYADSYDKATN